MKAVFVVLIAIAIGYVLGWYQFSYSVDSEETIVSTVQPEQQQQIDSSIISEDSQVSAVLDQDTVSQAVDTISKIDNISYTDLTGLVLSPTVEKVTSIIDSMSEPEIRLALNSITAFGDEDLNKIKDPSLFAKRLLASALFKSDSEGENNIVKVSFGTTVDSNNAVTDFATNFLPSVGKLYASFLLDTPADQVFIKWFQNTPYKLKLFNKYTINKDESHNYVWYSPKKWGAGLYTVEVYALDSELTKLAAGNFYIDEE